MRVGEKQEDKNELVLSYLAVRQALGGLGFILPTLLITYGIFSGEGIQDSISDFYHTPLGDIFVGIMCAIGVFLIFYRGYEKLPHEHISDRLVSRTAGLAAIGVAIFPVAAPAEGQCLKLCFATGLQNLPAWTHYGSAFIFFVCLAIFCLVLFPKSASDEAVDKIKQMSNTTYRFCGWLLILSIVLLFATFICNKYEIWTETIAALNLIFWFEVLGVLAFSVSWLTKGRALQSVKTMIALPTR